MEYTPRKLSFFNSTISNSSASLSQRSLQLQRKRRFQRSGSISNSKDKSHQKSNIKTQTGHFFVKNICKDLLTNKAENSELLNKISNKSQAQKARTKRQATPAKQRSLTSKQVQSQEKFEQSLENELNMLKMQRQLKEVSAQKQKFQAQNKILQQKITFLSLELAETINQNKFLQQKIKYLLQHDGASKQAKNGAIRIKKLIIQNKELQKPNLQNLEQRMRALIYQNNQIKDNLRAAEINYKELQASMQTLVNQRQLFLDDLVQQMKIELTQKDKTIKKLMIQLNIFLVRESQRGKKGQILKVQELENIKKKYLRILKKYHQVSQQLAAYKRKSERMASLFPDTLLELARKNSVDSLSFSP